MKAAQHAKKVAEAQTKRDEAKSQKEDKDNKKKVLHDAKQQIIIKRNQWM